LSTEREPIGKMLAEVLREIGLLFLTFVPLDAIFEKKPLDWFWFWLGIGGGIALVVLGVILETFRGRIRR
jgi:hypothetical protein